MHRWMVVAFVTQAVLTIAMLLALRSFLAHEGLFGEWLQRIAPRAFTVFPALCMAVALSTAMTLGVWWTFSGLFRALATFLLPDQRDAERFAFWLAWVPGLPAAVHAYATSWLPKHSIAAPLLLSLTLLAVGCLLQRRRSRRSIAHTMPTSP